jgi:hypothetical protein
MEYIQARHCSSNQLKAVQSNLFNVVLITFHPGRLLIDRITCTMTNLSLKVPASGLVQPLAVRGWVVTLADYMSAGETGDSCSTAFPLRLVSVRA